MRHSEYEDRLQITKAKIAIMLQTKSAEEVRKGLRSPCGFA